MFLIGSLSSALLLVIMVISMSDREMRPSRSSQPSDSDRQLHLRRKSLEQKQAAKIAAANKKKEKREEKLKPKDVWVHIGKLDKIIIYPIDDGYGITETSAHCTKYGLATNACVRWRCHHYAEMLNMRAYHDRACLAFDCDSKRAVVRNPDAHLLNDPGLLHSINNKLRKFQELATCKIQYENQTKDLKVHELSRSITRRVEELMGRNTRLKIGYRDRKSKIIYNSAMRRFFTNRPPQDDWVLDRFSANFSSYSLVNNDHIEDLKEKCERSDISYWNFRPNLVIRGNGTPYFEEHITAVKIGKVEFVNVIPCSHTSSINYDIRSERGDDQEEPFNYLSSNRKLYDIRPDLSSTLSSPIFGINMELKLKNYLFRLGNPGQIKVNDDVFVKLRTIKRSSSQEPGPSILKRRR